MAAARNPDERTLVILYNSEPRNITYFDVINLLKIIFYFETFVLYLHYQINTSYE
jgi:hypothetical protein